MKSVLVLAAHPDDEVLGCGGAIARLAGEASVVHVAHLADGVSSRRNFQDDATAHEAKVAMRLAALDAHAGELRDWPHRRSRRGVEHLARWRGATVGVEAAQAFIVGRHLS